MSERSSHAEDAGDIEPPGGADHAVTILSAPSAFSTEGISPADELSLSAKLRDVEFVTDAALSRLGPQEVLDALVDRVRQVMHADTTAVLLLDPGRSQLVATAASGLEEEVQQGVRIPVGIGFAGQIAAENRCVILGEVDHTNVVNPLLLQKGICSLLGAPLRSGHEVIGVMHVGTLRPRAFTSMDANLLQIAADRAALAVQALYAQVDREAATALQRSLLPSALPAVPGLQMAARYVPGTGSIGGDWYDVFSLPSGQVCAVIGDVAGSGLPAAVIMGRLRSALRAYSLETADPADMLDRLEYKMRHFEPDAMATVLCAVFSPDLDRVLIANAGHLPPVLALPGEPATPVPVASDPLIGVLHPGPRRVSAVDLPPGAALCLYTDGLVERRGLPIDDGIARLCQAVRPGGAEACCAAVMSAMSEVSPHTDDVALLIIHRTTDLESATPRATAPGPAVPAGDGRQVRWLGRHAVVRPPRELDVTNAGGFSDLLVSVAAQRPEILTVDMTAADFCDSAGLHAITHARQLLLDHGAELRMVLGDSPVRRILQLNGLDQVVPLFDTVELSIAASP